MQIDRELPAEQRKQMLVLQGQVFRASLLMAQHDLRSQLQPKALLRNAFGEAVESGADAARKLLSLQSLLDGRLSMILPLAGKGLQLIARRRLLRPLLLAAAAGTVAYFGWQLWQRKRAAGANPSDTASDSRLDAGQ